MPSIGLTVTRLNSFVSFNTICRIAAKLDIALVDEIFLSNMP